MAGGTGIVSAEVAAGGLDVLVADRSAGMLAVAGTRLAGRLVACDADRLPFADGSVDLVTMIWLLHLLPVEVADSTLAEAVRVLGPQGHLVTTVDKARIEQRARRDDLAHVATRRTGGDGRDRVTKVLAGLAWCRSGRPASSGRCGGRRPAVRVPRSSPSSRSRSRTSPIRHAGGAAPR